jgi:hypothetical protein
MAATSNGEKVRAGVFGGGDDVPADRGCALADDFFPMPFHFTAPINSG